MKFSFGVALAIVLVVAHGTDAWWPWAGGDDQKQVEPQKYVHPLKYVHPKKYVHPQKYVHPKKVTLFQKIFHQKKVVDTDDCTFSKLIDDLCKKISDATNELVEKVTNNPVVESAHSLITVGSEKICDLVEKVQTEATELHECVKPYVTNFDEKIKPLTDNFIAHVKPLSDCVYAQVKPLCDYVESLFHETAHQTKYMH